MQNFLSKKQKIIQNLQEKPQILETCLSYSLSCDRVVELRSKPQNKKAWFLITGSSTVEISIKEATQLLYPGLAK